MASTRENREKAAVKARRLIQVSRISLDNDRVGTPVERADRAEQWALEAEADVKAFRQYVEREATNLRRS